MANRVYVVETVFQPVQKVQGFRFAYLEDDAIPEAAQAYAEQIAGDFQGRLNTLRNALWPPEVFVWGVRVTAIEDPPFGPAAFVRMQPGHPTNVNSPPAPDSVTMLFNLRGTRIDGKPATGTIKVSGISKDFVDCNAIEAGFQTTAENAMRAYAPLNITIGGTNAPMIIQSKPLGVPENVIVESLDINPILGSFIDRIGDRSTGMPSRCTPPASCSV